MAREQAAKRREENAIEFGRIVAFSDGVFSIAITLLVLNLGIDNGLTSSEVTTELLNQWDNLLAFGLSFAVIGRFWVVHHRFFAEVEAFDGRLLGLNLLYLASVVLIPFSSEVLGQYGGETPSVVLYSVNLAAVVLIGLWMGVDARRRRPHLHRRRDPPRNAPAERLHRRRLPALDPACVRGAASGRLPLVPALPRSFQASGEPSYFRGGTVKAIERPGLAQSTDQPRSVTTA